MKIFQSADPRWVSRAQGLLRIMTGLLFMEHGGQKLFAIPPANPPIATVALGTMFGISGILELFGGFAIVLGFLTRPVAFLLCGEMAVAYFTSHAPRGFWPLVNHGELAVLYCFVYLFFAVAGAGSFSVDHVLARRSAPRSE